MEATAASSIPSYFKDKVDAIPFRASTSKGSGYLPPFVRGIGHLLYLIGRIGDSKAKNQPFIENELAATQTHWDSISISSDVLTQSTWDAFLNLRELLNILQDEVLSVEDDTEKIEMIRQVIDRALQFTVLLDRELLGLTRSDPGYDL